LSALNGPTSLAILECQPVLTLPTTGAFTQNAFFRYVNAKALIPNHVLVAIREHSPNGQSPASNSECCGTQL
jgi:hypothetical protein